MEGYTLDELKAKGLRLDFSKRGGPVCVPILAETVKTPNTEPDEEIELSPEPDHVCSVIPQTVKRNWVMGLNLIALFVFYLGSLGGIIYCLLDSHWFIACCISLIVGNTAQHYLINSNKSNT